VKVWAVILIEIIIVIQFAGCASIGPPAVDRDRFDYVLAISESWKRQTLLNLVKTRYMDAPVYMDVASVINQYVLEGEVELGFTWSKPNSQMLGGKGLYTDRPTITYNPLMGEKYSRSLLRPMLVSVIALLLQGGYPADLVLQICIQSINGIRNHRSGAISGQNADPEFYELLALFRDIQAVGGMGIHFKSIDKRQTPVLVFRPSLSKDVAAKINRAIQLLGLEPDSREIRVVFGSMARNKTEIAIQSRSMTQILIEYAAFIDVPQSDIDEGRVTASRAVTAEDNLRLPPFIRVRVGTNKPDDTHVAVPYRDQWFWIDDTDLYSKSSFSFLMMLFSLTERGDEEGLAPMITVPTN